MQSMICIVFTPFGAHAVAKLLRDLQKGSDPTLVHVNELHGSEVAFCTVLRCRAQWSMQLPAVCHTQCWQHCKNRLARITTKQQGACADLVDNER